MTEQAPRHQPGERRPPSSEGDALLARAKIGAIVIVVGALLLFFLQNLQDVEVNFLWFEWKTELLWALLVSALVGAASMFLLLTLWNRRRRPEQDE